MELKVDGRRAPLFLLLTRALKIVVFYRREWLRSGQELDARQKLLIIDPRRHEFTMTNLIASSISGVPLSTSHRQIFRVGLEGIQFDEINLR
jgi:hypothetical protein